VADLAGAVGRAVKEIAFEDEPTADPGADGDADRNASPPGRSHPPLSENRAVSVVVERRRQREPLVDNPAQRQVHPAEIGCEQHDPALGIQRTGGAYPDADDLCARDFTSSLFDSSPGERNEAIEDVALTGFGVSRLARKRMQGRPILGDAADDEVGASNVNSQDKSHATPPD
jgi:hypothetical protein